MRLPGVAAVLLAAALLAGCGGGPAPGTAAPDPSTSTPASAPPPTPRLTRTPASSLTPTPRSIVPTNLDTTGPAPSSLAISAPLHGGDISWPQCPPGEGIAHKMGSGSPLPTSTAQFVVIGLTNGPGFYRNPCLADQVAFVRDGGLLAAAYAVASYPDHATLQQYGGSGPFDASTPIGALENVGYQQARFNVTSMITTGLHTPIVWIDVEPVPYYDWSSDPAANAAVVRGAARGYRDAGYGLGVYSTPYLWQEVVGDLRLGPDVLEWRAAGHTSEAEAVSRCGEDWSIQGGPGVIGQWADDTRDLDVTCPGVTDVGGLFASLS